MRAALGSVALFVACCYVAHWCSLRADRDAYRESRVVVGWATRLMHAAELTPYGWVPSEASATYVDTTLTSHGASFILLDASNRIVRVSASLREVSAGLSIPAKGAVTVPGRGALQVLRHPIEHFGQGQGELLILKRSNAVIPAPAAWPEGRVALPKRPKPAPDWRFLAIGATLVGLGTFALIQFLAGSRLKRMTRIAAAHGGAHRFSESGSDEIARLSTALDTLMRQSRRATQSMGNRETNRRDWLSELSHDLRTPLAALQLRLDNARAARPNDLRSAVVKASQDCVRIQELASGFMDLAELEITEDFASEPVMPEELVGQVQRGLLPIAEDAGVNLRTRPSAQPTIYVDGHRMLRALENMTRNAIRHAASKVVLGVERHDEQLHFFVLDDGVGFDRVENKERLDYVEWRGRTHPRGLGLRVADRVARAHGGRLVITNRPTGTLVECVIDLVTDAPVDWPASSNGTTLENGS